MASRIEDEVSEDALTSLSTQEDANDVIFNIINFIYKQSHKVITAEGWGNQ